MPFQSAVYSTRGSSLDPGVTVIQMMSANVTRVHRKGKAHVLIDIIGEAITPTWAIHMS